MLANGLLQKKLWWGDTSHLESIPTGQRKWTPDKEEIFFTNHTVHTRLVNIHVSTPIIKRIINHKNIALMSIIEFEPGGLWFDSKETHSVCIQN
jgi:alpha-D-ribose 1-methylphosphonate 5-triphosphate diphosphatase PhnM